MQLIKTPDRFFKSVGEIFVKFLHFNEKKLYFVDKSGDLLV